MCVRYPTDVPIHRGSVGAMAISGPPATDYTFKPYVYRGTGIDEIEEREKEAIKAKAKAKIVKAKKARARKSTKPLLRPHDMHVSRWRRHQAAVEWELRRLEREAQREQAARKWAEVNEWIEETGWVPRRKSSPRDPRTVRPSAGWKPMTGADIESLLESM